jgi:hypothetical protein
MMNRNGFTLIEGIVAGAIASGIALSAFTLFQMTTQQSRAGMVHSMLNIKYENAVEQICASIRRSNSVLQTGEVWPPAAGLVEVNEIPAIFLYNAAGNDAGGYQITDAGILQERVFTGGEWGWQNYQIGNASVTVSTTPPAPSNFRLSADRKIVTLNLNFIDLFGGINETVYSRREVLLCRN